MKNEKIIGINWYSCKIKIKNIKKIIRKISFSIKRSNHKKILCKKQYFYLKSLRKC